MPFADRITRCPEPFDRALGQEAAAPFAELGAEIHALIAGTAGCSPYLRGLIAKNGSLIADLADRGPEATLETLSTAPSDAEPARALRQAKGQVHLLCALCDLGGVWTLEQVTGALTQFADHAVGTALHSTVAAEQRSGRLPDLGLPAGGLVAFAMGKMGAGELNYSSDIDLIMLFDGALYGEAVQEHRATLVRATRRMAKLLSEVTADGYVFRTDLRLRPDAAVTPVALSMGAAEDYYESVGRTWERAAYIKARPAAGDVASGEAFLRRLSPFVWRKHLDFAAIQDAHDMRLRIRQAKALHGPITLPGHNMKLGRGGIREIEFFTQTRQLISGGRDPGLRPRGTLAGLSALTQAGWVEPEVAEGLAQAYRLFREVEHRLQMVNDAQTHSLPQDDAGLDRLAAFMGQDRAGLEATLREQLEEVHAATEGFFAPASSTAAVDVPDDTRRVVEGWYSYPALRSERAVEIFERLKPDLLSRLSRAAAPEEALKQIDLFLAGLPAGVQLFSLFEANPQLIDLIVDIATTAPALASYLGRNAQVFDAVIGGAFFAPWPGCDALTEELSAALAAAPDYERQLDAARRWHKEWHFRVGVHLLRGLMSAQDAGRAYADLAEAILRALWPPVVAEFSGKHGPPPGAGAAVLGMGSLGARQLSATSDLDLILIYDAEGVEASSGRRPLPARQYYAKLTQAYLTALSAKTAEGGLYEVDMRLRPSGRQGPVATSLEAFRAYQRDEAWTWEHLALTRARPVAGSKALGAAVEACRVELLGTARDPRAVCADVAEMRARLHAAAPTDPWSVKRLPGGMQDIELLGQTATLLSGRPCRDPAAQMAQIWGAPDAREMLVDTHAWLWRFQAGARLLSGPEFAFDALGPSGQRFVLAQTGAANPTALAQDLRSRRDAAAELIAKTLAAPPCAR